MFKNLRRVLIFAAHGDDEIIGCGGTIAWLADRGAEVTVVTFTNRETAYTRLKDKGRAATAAAREMKAADKVLGVHQRVVLGLPNQEVENNRENFQMAVRLIRRYRPEIILTHRPGDHHRDHRAISLLVDEARWKAWERLAPDWGRPHETGSVLRFEIMGDKISKPHFIATFSKRYLNLKIRAMRTQISQLTVLRGVEQQILGSAMERGAYVGGKGVYGEAFEISDFHPTRVHLK